MILESHAVAWIVSAVLVVAAVIDGLERRVPNWLTFPMALSGIALAGWYAGPQGVGQSLLGLMAGLLWLMPVYAIGGMGAGDVKLLAALGAWTGWWMVSCAVIVGIIVGGIIAVAMIAWSGHVAQHVVNFMTISQEIVAIRNPVRLSEIAAERKPRMLLLPYGVPLTIGALLCFAWNGLY